jgi:hypothetical protein
VINPWVDLPRTSPHVLPMDRARVEAFNAKLPRSSPYRIHVDAVIPEPYAGAVATARVVVLQLNPGCDETNPASHADPNFRAALLANLRHELTQWPFYFFDPRFRNSHPGGRWWMSKTRKLAEAIPIEDLSQRLAVVEWFPYKSRRYRRSCTVPSQEYGFFLVESTISRGALIVLSRGRRDWEKSVPALRGYQRKLTLSSVQNVALTPNNLKHRGRKTPKAWRMLVDALE